MLSTFNNWIRRDQRRQNASPSLSVNQFIATLVVSLGPFAAGMGKGYSSPALASLQKDVITNPLKITAQEGSWIASLSQLGAVFGCLFGGLILVKRGRKFALIFASIPFATAWIVAAFAEQVEVLYCSSFIAGFASAITLLASQVYVSEIAQPEVRGSLSAILKTSAHLGTLFSFTIGSVLDWRSLASASALAPMLLFLTVLRIPESPSYLVSQRKYVEAFKALMWLGSCSAGNTASELSTLKINIQLTKGQGVFRSILSGRFPFRPFGISCGLMFFMKFSGVTVFFMYAVSIFQQVCGESISPHVAAIFLVFIQFLGSMVTGVSVDIVGRRPLLIGSMFLMSANLFGFGLYCWILQGYSLDSLSPRPVGVSDNLDWIPLTLVLLFMFFFSVGIGPISWLMIGEVFPLESRAIGGAISTSFSFACGFAAVKTYVDILDLIGMHGAFWIYSSVGFVGVLFAWWVVPETKGIQLESMEHHLILNSAPMNSSGSNTTVSTDSSPDVDEVQDPPKETTVDLNLTV